MVSLRLNSDGAEYESSFHGESNGAEMKNSVHVVHWVGYRN